MVFVCPSSGVYSSPHLQAPTNPSLSLSHLPPPFSLLLPPLFLKPPPPSSHCHSLLSPPSHFPMSSPTPLRRHRRKDTKLLVIMGVTGAGKSRLSIDLATRFPAEIINSDKIQIYKGLDITTNKISLSDRAAVPHHLLAEFDSSSGDVSPAQYRHHAASVISQITSRRRLPVLVGGSNSLIYALLCEGFAADSDPFAGFDSLSSELRYRCCFLWVDVSLPVLNDYLVKRVDEMFDSGMLEELAEFYSSEIESWPANGGLRKAIGVPEFERYFGMKEKEDDQVRRVVYEEAVRAIKDNTCQLAKRQMEKIVRLKNAGWDLHRLDGTDAFRGVLDGSDGWRGVWERQVLEPSVKIVNRFLDE